MEEYGKEILWIIGASAIGVVCSYFISSALATKLNEVSTEVLSQPLDVDITQKYVFWVLSGICIGTGLLSLLNIALEVSIQSLLLSSSVFMVDLETLSTVIPDTQILAQILQDPVCVKQLWLEFDRMSQEALITSLQVQPSSVFIGPITAFEAQDEFIKKCLSTWEAGFVDEELLNEIEWVIESRILNEIATASTLLNDPVFQSNMHSMLLHRSWDCSMLLSEGYLKQVAYYYRDHIERINGFTDDYLLSIAPYLREYYLIKQLHIAWLDYDGFPHFTQLTDAIEEKIHLVTQQEINIRLLEAIKRLGSSAGGVSNFELLMRNSWGKIVIENTYSVFPFIDGSNLMSYTDLYGNNHEQLIWKSLFLNNIAEEAFKETFMK